MKIKSSLGCSDHDRMEFRILRAGQKARPQRWTSGKKTLTSSKICLIKVLWDKALKEGRGSQESLPIFNHHLLQAQEQSISTSRWTSKDARRPAWMSEELLAECRHIKEVYRRWKQGQVTAEEYRDAV